MTANVFVFLVTSGVAFASGSLALWLRWISKSLWGKNNLYWPMPMAVATFVAAAAAGLAVVIGAQAVVGMFVEGTLPPSALIALAIPAWYAVRRVNGYVRSKKISR